MYCRILVTYLSQTVSFIRMCLQILSYMMYILMHIVLYKIYIIMHIYIYILLYMIYIIMHIRRPPWGHQARKRGSLVHWLIVIDLLQDQLSANRSSYCLRISFPLVTGLVNCAQPQAFLPSSEVIPSTLGRL